MSDTEFDPQDLNRDTLDEVLQSLSGHFISRRRLKISETTIGRGGFGTVQLAELWSSSWFSFLEAPVNVAVKEFQTEAQAGEPLRIAVRLAREMKVWASCKHPNILQFTGYHLSSDFGQAYLVSPYMKNGNVRDYLAETKPSIDRRTRLTLNTIMALEYLHSREPPIVHGDLKAVNVLVNDEGVALLSDLGLARAMADRPSGLTTSTGFKGTIRYTSPEVLQGEPRKRKTDIWSWGCLALEILTDKPPYHECSTELHVLPLLCGGGDSRKTPEPADMSSIPQVLSTLLRKCWNFEPSQRPDAMECLDKVRSITLELNQETQRKRFLGGARRGSGY